MEPVEHFPVREQINIRASRQQRALIDRAARISGKSRSEFMLDATCREAEDVLLDQVIFMLDEDTFDRFNTLVSEPPTPSEELRNLLRKPAPWE